VVLAVILTFVHGDFSWAVLGVIMLALWVVLAGVRDIREKTRHKGFFRGLPSLSRSYWGMQMAHLGLAVCAVGVVLTSVGSFERDMRMDKGDAVEMGGYRFVFEGAVHFDGPNFSSDKGTVRVFQGERQIAVLHPEKRLYTVQQTVMTEAGIDAGITRDLFVALGEPLEDGAWAVRVHIKPFVRWIWLGALLMGLGGFLAAADRRYRMKVKTRVREALGMAGAQA
jgi:cytochrome c-type biogenesis protein CcmF